MQGRYAESRTLSCEDRQINSQIGNKTTVLKKKKKKNKKKQNRKKQK
jgi:hypothetical protein